MSGSSDWTVAATEFVFSWWWFATVVVAWVLPILLFLAPAATVAVISRRRRLARPWVFIGVTLTLAFGATALVDALVFGPCVAGLATAVKDAFLHQQRGSAAGLIVIAAVPSLFVAILPWVLGLRCARFLADRWPSLLSAWEADDA